MTAPRKDVPTCPHCQQPAFSGMVGGQCWCCTFPVLGEASLVAVTAERVARFASEGIVR